MRHPQKMEELLPHEFESERDRKPIIYLPFAPVEYHGCHVSLNSDTAKGYEMCLRAAKITGGIVHPQMPIAPAGGPLKERDGIRDYMQNHPHRPGVFISAELCRKLLLEMLDVFAEDLKFKVCVMCGSHGPANTLAEEIRQASNGSHKGMKLLTFGSISHNLDVIQAEYEKLGVPRIGHGGAWETSMTYACGEDFFCRKMVDKSWPEGFEAIPEEHFDGNILPTRSELRLVSTEFGNRLMDITVQRVATEVNELLQG